MSELLKGALDGSLGFAAPAASEDYGLVLAHPAISEAPVALDEADEMEENLAILDDWRALDAVRYEAVRARGRRGRWWAGSFP